MPREPGGLGQIALARVKTDKLRRPEPTGNGDVQDIERAGSGALP